MTDAPSIDSTALAIASAQSLLPGCALTADASREERAVLARGRGSRVWDVDNFSLFSEKTLDHRAERLCAASARMGAVELITLYGSPSLIGDRMLSCPLQSDHRAGDPGAGAVGDARSD